MLYFLDLCNFRRWIRGWRRRSLRRLDYRRRNSRSSNRGCSQGWRGSEFNPMIFCCGYLLRRRLDRRLPFAGLPSIAPTPPATAAATAFAAAFVFVARRLLI